jgi:hypothetical protein
VRWHSLYEPSLHQELAELLDWQRFLENLIHPALLRFLDVFALYVACDGHNHGLPISLDVAILVEFSDVFGGGVTVHKWHVAVHQDELVPERVTLLDGILYLADCLFAVVCEGADLFSVLDS